MEALLFLTGYIFIAGIMSFLLTYFNRDEDYDVEDSLMPAIFWPVLLVLVIFIGPIFALGYLGEILKEKYEGWGGVGR